MSEKRLTQRLLVADVLYEDVQDLQELDLHELVGLLNQKLQKVGEDLMLEEKTET